ncbi:protein arginine N-methyltransferase 7 isoform X2 [Athalia rosae]|nr:protein arginine N-methyltransferase 7 isoform X2 [Athalia rosae]
MANCAVKIIEGNGYAEKIKLIFKRSTDITVGQDGDMQQRANILVTEVFDTELIGEGALSTFQHAHKVLLDKNSIVIPHSGIVWAQVIESSTVRGWNRIDPIRNSKRNNILVDTPISAKMCSGVATVHDLQLSQLPIDSFRRLTEPQEVCRFDWSGKSPLKLTETFSHQIRPIATGTAHAIFMWWDLNMDTDGQVVLSCAPVWEHPDVKLEAEKGRSVTELKEKIPWRDHWMQAVYYLSPEIPISTEEDVTLVTSHDEYSFAYHLDYSQSKVDNSNYQRPICDCFLHLAYSRTRIGQLNDSSRNAKYIQVLERKITPESICLCLSDGCLLGLAAAKLGAKKVIIYESNSLSRRAMETYVTANNLSETVQIITSKSELPPGNEVNLIFGEPNFVTSIVPWDNIYFWHLSSKYPENIARIPTSVTIKAIAVEFKDLYKIRAPLGICEGFDMAIFDKLVQSSSDISDNPIEAHPLWEYPARALSASFTITQFDFAKDINQQCGIKLSNIVPILMQGHCNGIALWVDWILDSTTEVTTGPIHDTNPGSDISWDPYTRQGVYLPRKTYPVTTNNSLVWSMNFSPLSGDVEFGFEIV